MTPASSNIMWSTSRSEAALEAAPGHRLRLWFSSSDFPNHEPLEVAGDRKSVV